MDGWFLKGRAVAEKISLKNTIYLSIYLSIYLHICLSVMFWPFDPVKNAIQGDAPEGSDTF